MPLNEDPTAGSAGHIADHAALKAEYVSRGATPAIPDYTSASTFQDHLDIHNALHADYGALGGSPALPQDPVGGHLAHHAALHAAYNLREGEFTPPLGAGIRASATNVGYFTEYGSLTVYSDGGTPPTGWAWDGGTPDVLLSTTDGATLELAQVNGELFINHTGVEVRKCVINGGQITNINETGTLLVEDTTVIGPDNIAAPGIRADGTLNIYRCHITKTGDGVHWKAANNTISQIYVGDQAFHDEEQHCDGMQQFMNTVNSSFTVEHSYIDETRSDIGTPMSASCTMGPTPAAGSPTYTPTINNNYFASGLTHLRFNGDCRDAIVTNNDFGPIYFAGGEVSYHDFADEPLNTYTTWSNNRDENSDLIPAP